MSTQGRNARDRLGALAKELYAEGVDPSITEARRLVHRLSESDREYAAAKHLQESLNDLRRTERQEAEESARMERLRKVEQTSRRTELTPAQSEAQVRERRRAARNQMMREREEESKREWDRYDYLESKVKGAHPDIPYEGNLEEDVEEMRQFSRSNGTGLRYVMESLEKKGLLVRAWVDKPTSEWSEEDFESFHKADRDRNHPWYKHAYAVAPHAHMEEYQRGLKVKIHKQAEEAAAEKFLQWTEELLGASFRLADGTITTWGQATVEQHRERVEMFERQATTGIMGASRHLQAIQEIEEHGATSLAEVVGVPA